MHPPDEYDCITPLYSFVDELISYSLMSARAPCGRIAHCHADQRDLYDARMV